MKNECDFQEVDGDWDKRFSNSVEFIRSRFNI